jgi:hypothetical protein
VALVCGRADVLLAELPEGMADRVSVGQGVTVRPRDAFGGARSLALVSDTSDRDKPCNTEEESIHLFQLPP